MGYLSQKKYESRKNIFLCVMMVIMLLLTCAAFVNPGFCVGFFNLFHLYCLSAGILIYALWEKSYKPAAFFAIILLINYTSLAATSNIFLSDKFDGRESVRLNFNPKWQFLTKSAELIPVEKISFTKSAKKQNAVAVMLLDRETPLTIISVDLKKTPKSSYPKMFKLLQDAIIKQDNPVIIFGDFGIPAWNKHFKKFLQSSGLSVKNRLMFTDKNFLKPSNFYILGFREMGLSDINVDNEKTILFDISFNPGQI